MDTEIYPTLEEKKNVIDENDEFANFLDVHFSFVAKHLDIENDPLEMTLHSLSAYLPVEGMFTRGAKYLLRPSLIFFTSLRGIIPLTLENYLAFLQPETLVNLVFHREISCSTFGRLSLPSNVESSASAFVSYLETCIPVGHPEKRKETIGYYCLPIQRLIRKILAEREKLRPVHH